MKRILIVVVALIMFFVPVAVVLAQTNCYDGIVPAGALPGQPGPRFCYINDLDPSTPGYPLDTSVSGDNQWYDNFNHGLFNTSFKDTNYVLFPEPIDLPDDEEVYWRHANHWMFDFTGQGTFDNGGLMRPNRTFTFKDYNGTPNNFEDDKFIIESDMAAGHQDYQGPGTTQYWQEMDISTGSEPTVASGRYAYDKFLGDYSFGCRLTSDRNVLCALKNNQDPEQRIWEMSWFQNVADNKYGGNPSFKVDPSCRDGGSGACARLGDYWRTCATEGVADVWCRDRFRIELEKDSVTLFVNGQRYFQQWGGVTPGNEFFERPQFVDWSDDGSGDYHLFPKEFFYKNGDPAQGRTEFYVYYSDISGRHPADVIRAHWDNLTVNTDFEPSCAENFPTPDDPDLSCQQVPPGPDTTPSPTPTPTSTPGIVGDINHDGVVNVQDFILLSNAFSTADPDADLNSDGTVNVQDFIILSNAFGS